MFTPFRQGVEIELGLEKNIVNEYGQVNWGILRLKEYLLAIHQWCQKDQYPFKAVCLDHLTRIGMMSRQHILGTVPHAKAEHKLTPTQGQWGMIFNVVDEIIELFIAIPRMKILIAHEGSQEQESMLTHEILIPGKSLPAIIRTHFSEIWYCQNNSIALRDGVQNNFVIRTVKSLNATARSCLNIPDNTPQSLGMIEILKRAGVDILGETNVPSPK